ncbi:YicC/YloC family endoribonuclease [Marinomonas sp. IMCC 4694]|uniref:YicC/YloC family endoribonuclease n=1 Tax=Marinomonas sp. IMCC 4694 TaxID=2605432 RepID=UPI0011E6FC03|nr:YicC/YloC family endoribonuclease [Marinomonas sp. IMCC 4694]TYL49220.1 YicC family protein [Marinomonas sp. IMCC 4694]
MTASMTAFSRQEAVFDWGTISWEIRSVNQRYLEPSFRLPENFRELEFTFRDVLRKKLNRGKLECQLRFQTVDKAATSLNINPDNAQALAHAIDSLGVWFKDLDPANPIDILKWPGILSEEGTDFDMMKKAVVELFNQGVEELIQVRLREGAELKNIIEQRLDAIDAIVVEVQANLPNIIAAQKQNLLDKLAAAKVDLDPMRVEAEIVMLAQKADVAEELDRLATHTKEVRRQMQQKGPIGRRLDFLMQELNREANTLSSKSIVVETTQSAVELKVLIEQMREQIQNIE